MWLKKPDNELYYLWHGKNGVDPIKQTLSWCGKMCPKLFDICLWSLNWRLTLVKKLGFLQSFQDNITFIGLTPVPMYEYHRNFGSFFLSKIDTR